MFTFPDPDPNKPLKYNVLWLIAMGYALDVGQFYDILRHMGMDMPLKLKKIEEDKRMPDEPLEKDINKHKYTQIKRALVQLQKEGWPINRQVLNGVAWYGMGEGFTKFLLERFSVYFKNFLGTLDYAKRFDVQLKTLEGNSKKSLHMPKITTEGGRLQVPLKLIPHVLKPLEKKD